MAVNRRRFLQVGGAGALGMFAVPPLLRAADFRVGAARDTSGYAATRRAIAYAGTWPAARIAGRRVIIKPNLVAPLPASSGVTTDPEVTRAVVDVAFESGAREVIIIETSPTGAHFDTCGYRPFAAYDPAGRIRLLDLRDEPVVLAPVPGGGLAYSAILVPELVLDADVVYISIGKLKTHGETLATLATKNQFGLPAVDRYISNPSSGRFAMHDRGIQQAIVDINRLRPIDFAVIDGIVAMEGFGPAFGTPVAMNLVLAGSNSVAVDRVGVYAMGLPQAGVRHLLNASRAGMGPAGLNSIEVTGEPLVPRTFAPPALAPIVEYPRVSPGVFAPALGQSISAVAWYHDRVVRQLDVLELFEDSPRVRVVRTLAPWSSRAAGYETMIWNGRDDAGALVAPGRYAIHVKAFHQDRQTRSADGIGWVFAL